MLISEELLLLILDDNSGKLLVEGLTIDFALAGGVLVELASLGKVGIAGDDQDVKKGHLVVLDPTPPGDPVLDSGLEIIVARAGRRPISALRPMKNGLRATLIERLVDAEVIRVVPGRTLGVLPILRWPANRNEAEIATKARVVDTLVRGVAPDPRTAALIALLSAMDAVAKVVRADDRRAVKQRAKRIAEGQWAPEAVRKAIQATKAAASGGVVASMGAAGS